MQARVQHDLEPSYTVQANKEDCFLACCIVFSVMLTDTFRDGDVGIPVRLRIDGKLYNLRRLQLKTKTTINITRGLLFTDNSALNAISEC